MKLQKVSLFFYFKCKQRVIHVDIYKNCVMKIKDYFDLFFPFAISVEKSYMVTNGKAEIKIKPNKNNYWIIEKALFLTEN